MRSLLCALVLVFPASRAPAQTAVAFGAPSQPEAPARWARVAFFDMDRVTLESATAKDAMSALQALREKRSKEAESRSRAIEEQQRKLTNTALRLSDQARADLTKSIERFQIDLQRFLEDARAELAATQREHERNLLRRLAPAVEKVAKQRGVDLVFSRSHSGLLWGNPELDISTDLIKQLDAGSLPR